MRRFLNGPHYVEDRTLWVNRMATLVPAIRNCPKVRVLGIDSVTDHRCYRIMRNIFLLFSVDELFRADVLSSVDDYRNRSNNSALNSEIGHSLSTAYILEEIAINIRIRLFRRLGAEYYPGKFIVPLIQLYKGKYSASVFEIAETRETSLRFDFFEWRDKKDVHDWFLV